MDCAAKDLQCTDQGAVIYQGFQDKWHYNWQPMSIILD